MRPLTTATLAIALAAGGIAALAPVASNAQIAVGIRVGYAPPLLPVYDQPPAPGYGYLWTPGYWGWDNYVQDYYWVPGTWILPPEAGYLWTPGYWAFYNGAYLFTPGYWGLTVGFYGGINYGFGYDGFGYEGGYWRGRDFFYNARANNFGNQRFANVFDRQLTAPRAFGRASFNGGPNGVQARPGQQELAALRERHIAATQDQTRQVEVARQEPSLRAAYNHGAPPIAATARPAALRGPGVVPARNANGGQVNGGYRPTNPAGQARPAAPSAQYAPPRGAAQEVARPPSPMESRPAFAPQANAPRVNAPRASAPPAYAPRLDRGQGGPPQPQARPEQKQQREGGPDRNDRGDRPQ